MLVSWLITFHLGRVQPAIKLKGGIVAIPRTRGHLFSFRELGSGSSALRNSEALLSAGEGKGFSGGRAGFSPRASARSPSIVPELRVVPRCLGTLQSPSEPCPKDCAGAGAWQCRCPVPYRCHVILYTFIFHDTSV